MYNKRPPPHTHTERERGGGREGGREKEGGKKGKRGEGREGKETYT